jgi:hypothetical protein
MDTVRAAMAFANRAALGRRCLSVSRIVRGSHAKPPMSEESVKRMWLLGSFATFGPLVRINCIKGYEIVLFDD